MGVGLQFAFALLILDTAFGKGIFDFTGRAIQKLIQFSNKGCKFVFVPLADCDLPGRQSGAENNLIVAILVVGIRSLAPERRAEMAKPGIRSMIGGVLASHMTATLAGILL